jgi:hypothetical protein
MIMALEWIIEINTKTNGRAESRFLLNQLLEVLHANN